MTKPTTSLFILANYIAAAANTYFWMEGGETASFSAAVAVFTFGIAQYLTACLNEH